MLKTYPPWRWIASSEKLDQVLRCFRASCNRSSAPEWNRYQRCQTFIGRSQPLIIRATGELTSTRGAET